MKIFPSVMYLDGTLRIYNINVGFVNVGNIRAQRLVRSMIVVVVNADK
jgi:hypothetical protein